MGSQTVGIPNTGGLIWIGQCAANGYGGFNIALNVNQGTSVAGQSNVYSTNIQGIGFRIRTLGSNANTWPTGVGVFNAAAASVYIGWRQIQFDLVKTAAIVGNGQLTPGEYGRAQVSGNPFDQYFRVVVAGGSILTPTCSVDAGSQNVTVPLGSVYRTAFQGAGSTTAPSAFVPAQLQFTAGRARNTVMITMDATADPSGQPEHCAWPQPDRVRSRAAWAYRYAMRSTTRSCSARPSTWGHRSRRATSCPSPRATSRPPAR